MSNFQNEDEMSEYFQELLKLVDDLRRQSLGIQKLAEKLRNLVKKNSYVEEKIGDELDKFMSLVYDVDSQAIHNVNDNVGYAISCWESEKRKKD